MGLSALIFVTLLVSTCIHCAKLPSTLKLCHLKDPKINDCLKENVQDAFSKIINGIPSLGVKQLDPLQIDHIIMGERTGPVSIKQEYLNATVDGILKNSKITSYKADLDKYILDVEVFTSQFSFVGNYEISGRVLLLPIKGKGGCKITLFNVKNKHTLIGEPFMKKGKKYWRLNEYKLTFEPGKVDMKFNNLFNGDKTLEDAMQRLVNDNWQEIFGEQKPQWEETFGLIFKDVTNRIFTKVPFNEIFLD